MPTAASQISSELLASPRVRYLLLHLALPNRAADADVRMVSTLLPPVRICPH